jgi:hypothetical protein
MSWSRKTVQMDRQSQSAVPRVTDSLTHKRQNAPPPTEQVRPFVGLSAWPVEAHGVQSESNLNKWYQIKNGEIAINHLLTPMCVVRSTTLVAAPSSARFAGSARVAGSTYSRS